MSGLWPRLIGANQTMAMILTNADRTDLAFEPERRARFAKRTLEHIETLRADLDTAVAEITTIIEAAKPPQTGKG